MNAPASTSTRQALVLFAHGARDARWREPFERLAQKLRSVLPHAEVRLAFLELMSPLLPECLAELAAGGATDITVVPIFLGQGGHVRRDLPALIDDCQRQYPALAIRCAAAVGEADSVLDAITAYCVAALPPAAPAP